MQHCIFFLFASFLIVQDSITVTYASEKYFVTLSGKAYATVVLSPGASQAERYAASVLQKYIEKISGVKLLVLTKAKGGNEILVGSKTDDFSRSNSFEVTDSLGEEDFVIRTRGDKLLIVGGGDWGTVYAVYSFLERLGCRWFMPGKIGEVIPHKKTIEVDEINDIERPSFKYRKVGEGEWSLANKSNNFCNIGGLNGYYQGFSSQNYAELLPPDKYFKSHPDYFAIHNGKRTADQLNLTSPDVLEIVVYKVDNFFAQHPDSRYPVFAVSPNDNSNFGDTKEDSLFGPTVSDQVMRFTNEVASRVGQKYPDKMVGVLAYQDYLQPPKTIKKMHRNVAITICRINEAGTYSYPITDHNYYSNTIRKTIEEWVNKADHILFYDYYAHYDWFGPWPLEKTIATDLRYYRSLGPKVEGLVPEFHPHWGTQGINDYIMAKLSWNVNLNVDSLINDYYKKFYGRVANEIRNYFNVFANRFKELNMPFWGQMSVWNKVYTQAVLKQAKEYLVQAKRLAGNDSLLSARVHLLELGFHYVEIKTKFQASRDDSGNFALTLHYMNELETFVESLPHDEVIQTSQALHSVKRSRKYLMEDIARVQKNGVRVDTTAIGAKIAFIKDWHIIGPFPNKNNTGWEAEYPPEKEIDFHESYKGKGDKKVKWRLVRSQANRVGLDRLYPFEEQAIAYAVSFVYAPAQRNAFIALGSDDGVAAWVNGERIGADNALRSANAFQDAFPIILKKGWNTIMLKITQNAGDWGFYCSIVDSQLQNIPQLQCTANIVK